MLRRIRQSTSETRVLRDQGYRLIKQVGEGAYARVYLGEFSCENTGSFKLACKIITVTNAPRRYSQRFLPRELKILIKLKHPHIVHIHSIFQRKMSYFIFMRYAEKGDLFEYIKSNGAIKENHARIWVRQIALALQYLHTLEIAHRDLKCENILVTEHLNVKLTDFGFARCVTDELGQRELSETFCGSKQYVAPEILRGIRYNPKAADMWSMGVIIYTMLNKALPFDERDKRILFTAQVQKRWKFRDRMAEILSQEIKELIISLLEPDVTKRAMIQDVVNSKWIAMDPKLQKLSAAEVRALSSALDEAQSLGDKLEHRTSYKKNSASFSSQRPSKDVVYWKHMNTGLEVDASILNKWDDVILG